MSGRGKRLPLEGGFSLRLLTALEVIQARREGAALAADRRERALCANACLLARALERSGEETPVFPDGKAALEVLTAEEIAALAARWDAFRRENDPGLERLCPACRSRALGERCPACGRENTGREGIVNPAFDMERFQELKGGEGFD